MAGCFSAVPTTWAGADGAVRRGTDGRPADALEQVSSPR
jgi:hypothetical protein